MTIIQKIRMTADVFITFTAILLMGGLSLFSSDLVHEILGLIMYAFWAVHLYFHHSWYKNIFIGKYNPYRIMQTVINCLILLCALLLMISGIIISNHMFTFLNSSSASYYAKLLHLVASHWYFIFMSMHLGLHVSLITKKIKIKKRRPLLIAKVLIFADSLYAIFVFISRGLWKYLILQQKYFFLNLEKGSLLFFFDYLSILILFALLSHYTAGLLKRHITDD